MSRAPMVLNALIKRVAMFVNALMECLVMRTRAVVSMKIPIKGNSNVRGTKIAHRISTVIKNLALALALIYCAVPMHSVSPKIMPAGVDAKLDLLKIKKANVSHVSDFLKVLTHFTKLKCGVNLLKTPPKDCF